MLAVPAPVGRNVTVQVVGLVEPVRAQEPMVPVAVPVRKKETVPVGAVGLALASVTVAVQVEAWFTSTGVSQETVVVVE